MFVRSQRATALRMLAGSSAAVLALSLAPAAYAQDAAPPVAADAQATPAAQAAPEAQQSTGAITAPSGDQGQGVEAATAPGGEDIVVTGVRASLRSAQAIKRNSDQIVDSIVAEDIGKLPDRNVAEALQRISGIQIQRNYGEGSSVAIRGLTQVRTEINGRDSFTASGSNGLSFEDVPSELLAGVDVYKNPAADMIEDQISGTINLRTRKPFDFDGFRASASVTNSYFDLLGKSKPSVSGLISDRWDTGIGEIGILVDVAYQKTAFRQDVISTEPFYTLDPTNATDAATLAALGRTGQVTTLPHGTGIGQTLGDRRRLGTDISIQWRPSSTLEFTGEVLRSDYKFQWQDYSYFAYTSGSTITPLAGAPFTFAPNGDFQSGTFADVPTASNTSLTRRHSVTTDYSLNGKWTPSSKLTITADGQYVRGTTKNLRSIVSLSSTPVTLYQDISGAVPVFNITNATSLTDPTQYGVGYYLDHIDESTATNKAARLDAEYKVGDGFLQSVKVGARYANRKNTTQDAGYRFVYLGRGIGAGDQEVADLSDFFRGQANLFGNVLAFPASTTLDYDATLAQLGITSKVGYTPTSLNEQSQKTYTGYATAKFAANDLSMPIDGTVGLRVVRTELNTSGFYAISSYNAATGTNNDPTFSAIDFTRKYTSFLPSVNIRLHITDNLQARVAASRAVSRPTFTQLNPSLQINAPSPITQAPYTASGGNPFLKPLTANQLDGSLEWYFAKAGSLTGAVFYKRAKNFIQTAVSDRVVTFDDGTSATYQVTSYLNGDKGTIKGFEVAYNQFFDFLPAPLDGFGVQANFTYVDSKAPSPSSTDTAGNALSVPLELLSKYSYNLVGIYEKNKLSARAAYNWRSKYVVTTAGNGTGALPIINKGFGQLDASVNYNVTDHFSLGVDGTNLLDTRRATYFGVETRPRDVQLNDRRISGTARITF
ncbi:TonB-dependent receptor [Sphingomonas sp. 4RDLI-65]|uniref:TonB-dependent receptor n=1 Tax=Sphingomonas sp. 4RDLI-65 TaxID=3111641 RepID=UPI003C207C95